MRLGAFYQWQHYRTAGRALFHISLCCKHPAFSTCTVVTEGENGRWRVDGRSGSWMSALGFRSSSFYLWKKLQSMHVIMIACIVKSFHPIFDFPNHDDLS